MLHDSLKTMIGYRSFELSNKVQSVGSRTLTQKVDHNCAEKAVDERHEPM